MITIRNKVQTRSIAGPGKWSLWHDRDSQSDISHYLMTNTIYSFGKLGCKAELRQAIRTVLSTGATTWYQPFL